MRLANLLLAIVLSSIVGATPVQHQDPSKRAYGAVTMVTGAPGLAANGKIPIRKEIRAMKNDDPDQFSLYILGLRAFQMVDETLPTSFYQIAGIHGKPYKVWEDAQGVPGQAPSSYCPHLNALFLPWHRPYLALYEQELYRHVSAIAASYPPHLAARFRAAADDFRIPYWDWALGQKGGPVPDFFMSTTIQVVGTDGQEQSVPNPLHHFDFHPAIAGDFDNPWAARNTTLRWPTSDFADAMSQNNKMASYYNAYGGLDNQVSKAFGTPLGLNDVSLRHFEQIHGWLHYMIGGAPPDNLHVGNMWPVEYSAFEPLFMLHHCNVDRLFAIWEAVHPDLYLEPFKVTDGRNMWLPLNSNADENTPLQPFWRTPGTFWTSKDVRDTTALNYAYIETQPWNFLNMDAYRSAVNVTIAQLYSSTTRVALTNGAAQAEDGLGRLLNDDNTFTDWNIRIEGLRMRLPSTFVMRFSFTGDAADVGSWNVLMPKSAQSAQADKAKRMSTFEPKLTGSVELTASLLDLITAGKLQSLQPSDVVPYLTENLVWKVYADNGNVLSDTELDALTAEVVSSNVRIPENPNQPVEYSLDMTPYPEVTKGRPGGVKD